MAQAISEQDAIDSMRLFGPVLPLVARWDWEKEMLLNVDKKNWKLAGKNGPITANTSLVDERDPISKLHREAERIRSRVGRLHAPMGAVSDGNSGMALRSCDVSVRRFVVAWRVCSLRAA